MIMGGTARAADRPLRRLARLLLRPNQLRRRTDRIEGVIVLLLLATFLAVVAAVPFFGERFYRAQRADAAQLHQGEAVLSQGGPAAGDLTGSGEAVARWQAPGGQQRSGILTTVNAPGIWGAPAGTRVQVWLTESGMPSAPPPGTDEVAFSAVVISIGAACGAGIALIICYWLCRVALDRRRLAAWESAWSLTGPRWTSRR
jgi:hypothetical protein